DDLRQRINQARDDLAFVEELDAIALRSLKAGVVIDNTGREELYRQAFLNRGFDPRTVTPDDGAAWVNGSRIRKYLLVALDNWAMREKGRYLCDRLLAITRRADPGDWSDRIRDSMTWDNPDALERLAREVDLDRTSPHLIALLFERIRSSSVELENL